MHFANSISSNLCQNKSSLSFVPYDPNLQRKTRKRKARSDEDESKLSGKKSTRNGAGSKTNTIPSTQTLEPATQTLNSYSEPVDDEVIEISHLAFYHDEREREDKDKASSNLENQILAVVEGKNAVVNSFATNMILITAGETRSGYQPHDNGDSQQIILEDLMATCTSATCTDDIFSRICSSKTPDRGELSNQLPSDVCVSGFPRDREDEDIISNDTTTFDVVNRDGDAANSVNNSEELCEPVARSIFLSNSVNQDVISESIAKEHHEIHDSINVAGSPRANSEPFSDDEGDRHEVEQIIAHFQHDDDSIRYFVIWRGWPIEKSTWEPAENLRDCPEPVQRYWAFKGKYNSSNNATTAGDHMSSFGDQIPEDDRDRHEIKKILDHDEHNGLLRWLVLWSDESTTWESASNLDNCRWVIEQYWGRISQQKQEKKE
ncbi:uncharacterized protein SETTUDRAFT_22600 [Exserohilum turcica Et28A]|uniref:Chromo domain-containing protein n=1 Tax=Exserohilum turcicum (strain 28A) TaxID=671987 RepID=R0K2M5_EXST2|nr:uncharacterized protein SETTUDRAFT_22600 [Exserohilum turcica Et28A]EOA82617.1 hypothetical protein SETTUDRAFT_22600 [Exserohilum turcica Et28A]